MQPNQLKPTIVPIPGHDAHTIQQKSATTASMMMKQTFTFSDKLSGSLIHEHNGSQHVFDIHSCAASSPTAGIPHRNKTPAFLMQLYAVPNSSRV